MNYFNPALYKLHAYVPGEQPAPDAKICKLNTNENPYPPSPKIPASVEKIMADGLLRKYPDPVSSKLAATIAKQEGLQPSQVLLTNGSDEGLAILFRAVLQAGDTFVMPYPTYSLYTVLVESLMVPVNLAKVPLLDNLHFNIAKMKQASGKLLCFAYPNAPTGILHDKAELIDLVRSFPGIVLCDEAYIDFSPMGSSMVDQLTELPNLIISRTFSKSYSLAGLRLGYLLGSPENIGLLHKLKDSYNVGMLEQAIGLSAFLDQEYFQGNIKKVLQTRASLKQSLQQMGFAVLPSAANFVFTKPPVSLAPAELFQKLKEKEIFVRYFTDELSKNYVRISVGTEEENEYLIQTIRSIVGK